MTETACVYGYRLNPNSDTIGTVVVTIDGTKYVRCLEYSLKSGLNSWWCDDKPSTDQTINNRCNLALTEWFNQTGLIDAMSIR